MLELVLLAMVFGIIVLGGLSVIGLISQPLLEELWGMIPGFIRWPVVGWWERRMRTWRMWQAKRELRAAFGPGYSPNRLLDPRELMEREALRRGVCPHCGCNVKGFGGLGEDGLACPYHTEEG